MRPQDFVNPMPLLLAEAKKCADRGGDKFFMIRQLEYWGLRYRECRCEGHGCGGCQTIESVGAKIKAECAALLAAEPDRCEHERRKARDLWMEQRRVEGVSVAEVAAEVRARRGEAAPTAKPIDRERYP